MVSYLPIYMFVYRFYLWIQVQQAVSWEIRALSSYFVLFCLMNHTNMHQYTLLFKYLFIKWQWQQSLCHYTLPLPCPSVFLYYVFLSMNCFVFKGVFSAVLQFYHCLLFCVIHSWSYFRLNFRTVSFFIGKIF